MRTLIKDTERFLCDKKYCLIVWLTAALSYGFKISHVSVGIDDTCTTLYFEEGLAPAVGRWVFFLMNKVFHLSEFSPWMTDLAGVIFLVLSASVWCAALWRVFGDEIPQLGYTFFAAVFISCPLISEVFVYYLHNGIGLGYGVTAIALLFVLDSVKKAATTEQRCKNVLWTTVGLTVAIGFYESFMMVYMIGGVLLFLAVSMAQKEDRSTKMLPWALWGIPPIVLSMLLRGILIKCICAFYRISIPQNFNVTPRTGIFAAHLSTDEFFMYLKRYFVKYGLNFFAYLPITVLVAGTAILILLCMVQGIKRKNIRLPLMVLLIPVLPALMILIDGKESYYRASQYVPLIGAFAVLLLTKCGQKIRFVAVRRLGVFGMTVLLWNQCADMNRWFYMDYLKYEYFKTVIAQVSEDLNQIYDSSKPVVFRGECPVPTIVLENAGLRLDSFRYKIIKDIGGAIDGHLIEKYNAPDGTGYVYAETPFASTIQWGITAFDGTAREIKNFAAMQGFDFVIETDLEKIEQAEKLRAGMPCFPQDGYIEEFEEYIIINL